MDASIQTEDTDQISKTVVENVEPPSLEENEPNVQLDVLEESPQAHEGFQNITRPGPVLTPPLAHIPNQVFIN